MNTDKKTRGRPKKKVSLLETNNDDLIITDNSLTQTENLDICNTSIEKEIKPRGRPKKYSDEERKEKYKEATRNWNKMNYKQLYQENSTKIKEQTKDYQDRARYAYKLLYDLWQNKDTNIEFKTDKYKFLIQKLIEDKEINLLN
jgi:hypothetical protein